MLKENIPNFLLQQKRSVVYIASSNKNIDFYSHLLKNENRKIIELMDLQEEERHIYLNYKLLKNIEENENSIIFTSVEGLIKKYFQDTEQLSLKLNERIERKELENYLLSRGYKRNYLVEKRMEYSWRGNILDIYPPDIKNPIRIEFFGDEIDRITFFSIITQKTINKIDAITLYFSPEKKEKIDFYQYVKNLKKYKPVDIYVENYELLRYKYEEAILRDRENECELRDLFHNITSNSKKIEVENSEKKYLSKEKGSNKGIKYENISQIREGDYIIHKNYGVGIYLGIESIEGKDYLSIKYADEDKLYVPIESLSNIEKFLVTTEKLPEIYNLGRRGFKKKREKLEKDMLQFAKEIIEIQAKRETNLGYSFSPDTVWQQEFEEKFPYIETKGQREAIEAVKRDMESTKVMDRIVCGDVGFGKTEIAIRAAFKSIMDGKQVILLAPTTVLAQQHGERFRERFKDYPITIEILSRLSTVKEYKKILNDLNNGTIDILIGTHKLLSDELKFKDLGLIIVDEEQKFGVKAKERLKRIKKNIDMLTLTATPIPRTLNYALLGIREISVIDTAPEGRIPIETKFLENEKESIKEAIMKELSREGQVFYIYNKIKTIENKVKELKNIVPEYINISFIHGQMYSKEIKERLKAFENGEIDILISTTIIENGIDIENANTILIEGIDKLGLSQIYQLRGRVGRGKRKAYCYLVMDKGRKYNQKTQERCESLNQISELGGGFKLSLEDMRIRGVGELLGEKQHGVVETFGYNLYIKLLQEEIQKIKGEYKEEFESKIDLKWNMYIPKDYISGDERLIIYRRLIDIKKIEQIEEIQEELRDRFGKIPNETLNLLKFLELKLLAKKFKVVEITQKNLGYFIKFDTDNVILESIMQLIQEKKAKYIQHLQGIEYQGDIFKFFDLYQKYPLNKKEKL